ncbi:hypothetical protein MMC17_009609 [Xylographa soralifera]|nr:hypothetical protein [Xylographa soralifera]
MPRLLGLEVGVSVNDVELQEYEEDGGETSPNSVTKYIEAVSNAEFAVKARVSSDYDFNSAFLSFSIFVDGRYIENIGLFFDEWDSVPKKEWEYSVLGAIRRKRKLWIVKPFRFSGISVVEGLPATSSVRNQNCLASAFGTIVIKAFRMMWAKDGIFGPKFDDLNDLEDLIHPVKIAEKLLKGSAVSHSVKLGLARTHEEPNLISGLGYADGCNSPIALFTFKYRSKKALQDLLLIPRTRSPTPLEDRPLESLSADEMKILIRRMKASTFNSIKIQTASYFLQAQTAQHVKLKRERSEEKEFAPKAKRCGGRKALGWGEPKIIEISD